MAVKSTVENLSPTRVRLAVEVPYTELKPSLDKAYKTIASQVRVPGFRPGKVPARVIDQRVGRGAVLQEALNEALPRLYGEAAREHELAVLGQPEITDVTDADKIVEGADWTFTAEVDVRPEITLPDLASLAVSVDDAEVTDAAVDEQLDELRERFGTLVGVERAVETGDYVSLDLATAVDGEAIDEGSTKGMSYVVGSGDLVEGLDDAIVGTSAGDSTTFATTLQHGDHAGQQADVTATVNSVKIKELPDADDEFAQLASEFDTIAELRGDLGERLGRVRVLEQGAQARDKLLEQLIADIDFPLPQSSVDAEVEYREHDVVHSLNHDEGLMARYLEAQGQTREEFDAELRASAEKAVRAQFILDRIADDKQVQVADGELTEYLVRQAQRYQMSPQDFANQLVQGGNLPALVADLRRNKALAELLESATITDASGKAVDLAALEDADEDGVDDDGFEELDDPGLDGDVATAVLEDGAGGGLTEGERAEGAETPAGTDPSDRDA